MFVREGKCSHYENEDVTFGRKDVYIDALVIIAMVGLAIVRKLLVDNGGSVNILLKAHLTK